MLLPNAWDVASAQAVVAAGFPAVATSSVAVAEALGVGDGEQLPVDVLFGTLAAITRAVGVPVTADLERGYGLLPRELVQRLAAAGVVGCNLEDSDPRTGALVETERQADLLASVRQAAVDEDWDLVLNARIDAALQGAADPLEECLTRARAYTAADCVYPIMLAAESVADFVAQVQRPVNILQQQGVWTVVELAALGVARISWGAGVWRTRPAARASLLAAAARSQFWDGSCG
ncbi:isocitrate lyase/phosphoenolpyruvate mutase family protein [Acidothermaceae bacterium B102]|nr:isocitrate lyase/phosphoenolpyruvate mutase family protein [Acidothermaceae bacterium B102]